VSAGACYDDTAAAALYSPGTVAGIVVVCIIASLVVGFVAGLCLSSRRPLRCLSARVHHLWPPAAVASSSKRPAPSATGGGGASPRHLQAVQNAYDLAPGRRPRRPRYDAVPTAPPPPPPPPRPPKDCNRRAAAAAGSAVVLQPKLNNLYTAVAAAGAAGAHRGGDAVDLTPRPPPRRHRPSRTGSDVGAASLCKAAHELN